MTDLTPEQFAEFMRRQEWTFAKTMPENPHWYINRKKLSPADQLLYDKANWFIRENGYKMKFKKSYYMMYDCEGYMYWSMMPPPYSFILNRKKKNHEDKNDP